MVAPSAQHSQARIGQMVAGKYRVERLLGSGGMGAVFEAENTWTRRKVAIKLLHAELSTSEEAVARFTREAQNTSQIEHPSIVDVLDMGRDDHDGSLYIVQELLSGIDLRTLLQQRG